MLSKKLMGALSVTPAPTDDNFENVTLLLHGDGTNGAQNNTFLDSSTNAFSITRNGNTTQGTFTPYGDNWSNYFDNVGDYLSVANNSALQISSSDMTIEAWVYSDGDQDGDDRIIGKNSGYSEFSLFWQSATQIRFVATTDGASWTVDMTANSVPKNQWVHVAVTRSGSNWTIWINGVSSATDTQSGTVTTNTSALVIGGDGTYNFKGYISNARLVKGTAVYTAAFTPPTAPLTAITNTSLLTCQSNRFRDASSNNFTITVNGNPSVQRFSPFSPTAAYSTSTNGGSGYFDGSGDYLSTPSSSEFTFGTGNFTIDFWVNWDNSVNFAGEPGVFQSSTTAGGFATAYTTGVQLGVAGGVYWVSCGDTFSNKLTTTAAPKKNEWNHIAIVRNSTTLTVYVNGVSVGTQTNSNNITATYFAIGGYYDTNYLFKGYLSNFRVIKGTAVYTSGFTPPTSPTTAISGTSLLCNFTNAGILDNAMMNNLETVGNAQIDTGTKKFGTGSIEFDGTTDYLIPASADAFNFYTGDYTIEFWAYFNALNNNFIIDYRPNNTEANNHLAFRDDMRVYYGGTAVIIGSSLSTGQWYHIALCRSGTNTKLFVNGTQSGSTYTSDTQSLYTTNGRPVIGAYGYTTGSYSLNAFIDDFRVTKGVARYTANFTPPTAAFPDL